MLAVALLLAGFLVLVAALMRLAWVIGHHGAGAPITETHARKNAAPLTTAILASDHHARW